MGPARPARERIPRIEATDSIGGADTQVLLAHPPPPIQPSLVKRWAASHDRLQTWAGGRGNRILMGALNATPFNPTTKALFHSGVRNVHHALGRQRPTWSPLRWGPDLLALDYIAISKGLTVTDAWRGPRAGSDHRPMHARVTPYTCQ